MPKMKTHSGAKKRFQKKDGKISFAASGRRHLLTDKSTKRKRNLRKKAILCSSDFGRITRLLPNS